MSRNSGKNGGRRSLHYQTVTLSERRATISASVEVTVASEPLWHQVVEIRDASRGHKLITLIEIVSLSNKRAGVDRRAYLRKQREVLESDASLEPIPIGQIVDM